MILTREPGGTVVGERIRDLLLHEGSAAAELAARTDALLFNAARAQLVVEVIRPALDRGAIVIATRFSDSTLAYQGFGAGLPLTELRELERFATGALRPDLTVILDLPAEAGLARKTLDQQTRFETGFDIDFHRRVRAGFLALADAEPGRFVVVDALEEPESVARIVARAADDVVLTGSPLSPAGTAGEPDAAVERIHG